MVRRILTHIDWVVLAALLPILVAGLLTMNSFSVDDYFASRQLVWIGVSLAVLIGASLIDWRFLRKSNLVATLFLAGNGLLILVLLIGQISRGVQSWLSVGGLAFQPADLMKLILILVLAKYFSRRHIEIAHIRHIIVSGIYAFIPFVLILVQPDFGSAIIVFAIWLGLIVVSGVSKKHLLGVTVAGLLAFLLAWTFLFADYQKDRIVTFLHPLADIQGAGYNAFQSTIAVGSGGILGKGLGYGTQSRLEFLPEYETDFIFAAFAEEWGFVGVIILFGLYGVIVWRLVRTAMYAATNFESLFTLGVTIMLGAHFIIHVGMNVGLLPVTGLPLPFMSYGGSHLLVEMLALGMVMGMRRYALAYHRDDIHNEFIGPQ
ncbi:MAG: rod shape-determining protein RodA [Candidatus Vogelbacteria bacterium CG10_big_fil_rev_8_21_14_0_10_50_13]|uniref:Rod shape-determining protein RodA n=1 Tax=Candidatus Vogelbacteria bacterium CG10_big_fil_rev_8_21_14_0_10_50_13 TaxID=1975044 RepID=A0A2H0RGW9_9BACT|nr:MAG: rod shape-determining protein RodA [Candidatus Vogelbacteria bacterium CG10_big_fil_rev_8_21_14_0_10_50_13]